MYEIIFSEKAQRQLYKLPFNIKERILKVLERVRIRPLAYFEKLADEESYKLRVGDYRVIADIYSNKLMVLVLKVGHRKNIYKK